MAWRSAAMAAIVVTLAADAVGRSIILRREGPSRVARKRARHVRLMTRVVPTFIFGSHMASHKISTVFTGDVLTLYLELEGREVHLAFDGDVTWSRTNSAFDVEGDLSVHCVAKGFAGRDCTLEITVDGGDPYEFTGSIPGKTPLVINRLIAIDAASNGGADAAE